MLDELDPVDNVFIPCGALKICEEARELDEDSDANRLLRLEGGNQSTVVSRVLVSQQADG